MNPLDFSKQLVALIRGTVGEALATVNTKLTTQEQRLSVLETRPLPVDGKAGNDGADGTNGKDGVDAPAPTDDQVHKALLGVNGLPNVIAKAVQDHLDHSPVPAGKDGKDGSDGKDAPEPTVALVREALLTAPELPGLLAATVQTHLKANPVPAGKDGMDGDDGLPGEPGEPGKDAPAPTAETVKEALLGAPSLLADAVALHLTAYPPPGGKDGAAGDDGKDAPAPTAETVRLALATQPELLAGAVATHMADRMPRDGKDAPEPTQELVLQTLLANPTYLASAVDQYMKANPVTVPKDGVDGKDADMDQVQHMIQNMVGVELPAVANAAIEHHFKEHPIPAPKDGTSVALDDVVDQLKGMQALWALDFERRAMELFHNVVGKMQAPRDGKDGTHGKDGLGFDDLAMEYDGQRMVKFVFARGDQRKEFNLRVPAIIHRGIYKKDAQYEEGDCVTWGGSMWLAKGTTLDQQPGTNGSWQLVVKRGNDGKDAK